jgi:hypothetical protein
MKKFTLSLLCGILTMTSFAQFASIEVEEVPNAGKVPGKTFRIYAVMTSPKDQIDAVFAEVGNPLSITSTKPFYQHPQGGALTADLQRFDLQNDPVLGYDSWFTIGATDNYNNYLMPFTMDSVAVKSFESGNGFVTSEGAWFVTPDKRQTQADGSKRILLMQLTTEGKITGAINLHGRTKTERDASGNTIDGGEMIEERGIKFTAGK